MLVSYHMGRRPSERFEWYHEPRRMNAVITSNMGLSYTTSFQEGGEHPSSVMERAVDMLLTGSTRSVTISS